LSNKDTILIKERRENLVVDSFYVVATHTKHDTVCNIEKSINIKNSFEILIPGSKTHWLNQIKMGMVPEFTNGGEGYGCGLVALHLDSVWHGEHDLNYLKIQKE
jgi:hypothetical protein